MEKFKSANAAKISIEYNKQAPLKRESAFNFFCLLFNKNINICGIRIHRELTKPIA